MLLSLDSRAEFIQDSGSYSIGGRLISFYTSRSDLSYIVIIFMLAEMSDFIQVHL